MRLRSIAARTTAAIAFTLACVAIGPVGASAQDNDSITLSSPEFNPIRTIHAKVPPRASVLSEIADTTASATEVVTSQAKEAVKAAAATEEVAKKAASDTKKKVKEAAEKIAKPQKEDLAKPLKDPDPAKSASDSTSKEEPKSHGDVQLPKPSADDGDGYYIVCDSAACDMVGGCDQPGGCGRTRRPVKNLLKGLGKINNPLSGLRNPFSGIKRVSCDSPDCDLPGCDLPGCDTPGGRERVFDGRVRRRIESMDIGGPNGPVKRLARKVHSNAVDCDVVDGCDQPGGHGRIFDGRVRERIADMDIGGPNGPAKRLTRRLTHRSQSCDDGCDFVDGFELNDGCDRVFDGRIMRRLRDHDIRDRILQGDGPIRRYARSRSCDLAECDVVGGCDQPEGCDYGFASPSSKNYKFLVNGCRDARNPGVLFRWGCQNCLNLPKLSEPLVTDRPDFTEASSVVGLRVTQVELGYTYIYDDRGVGSTKINSYPEILVRRGIFRDWLELRLAWNYFDQESNDVETDGSSDIQLGFKLGLTSQIGWLPELALITQMTVPTGSDAFNAREVQPGVNLIYGWTLSDALGFAGSTQFNRSSDDSTSESYYEWAQSAALSYTMTDRIGLYGEYFGLYPTSADTVTPQNFFNGGLTFLLNNDVQWDIRAGTGLDSNSPDYFAGTGLSIRFR